MNILLNIYKMKVLYERWLNNKLNQNEFTDVWLLKKLFIHEAAKEALGEKRG
jgi:hypothetical protein